jgi:hypothetical protein
MFMADRTNADVSSSSLPAAGTDQIGLMIEERSFSLFQPDTLLPAQYLATTRRTFHLEPEKRLMLAVLEDGIACFQQYAAASRPKGRTLFQEAQEWILDEDDGGLYSFTNICDALGFDPDYLREGLRRWKDQKPSQRMRDETLHPIGGTRERAA